MELELGLAISAAPLKIMKNSLDLNLSHYDLKNKRMFEEAFGENFHHDVPHTTLSLFTKDKDDEDDGDDGQPQIHNHQNNIWREGDESSVIGWPPIKSYRKKVQWHGHGNRRVEMHREHRRRRGSAYVKVNMEGVGIARKVDLSLHRSYQTLTNTLIPMFGRYSTAGVENVKQHYRLTYQDKEGDWLLAGDRPWGTFKQSVQRLKLLKKDG